MRLISLLLIFAMLGCSKMEGTGTGNPNRLANSPVSSTGDSLVFYSACVRVSQCHPEITYEDCRTAIADDSHFALKLGLHSTPPPTVSEIVTMQIAGTITPDQTAEPNCVNANANISCTDPVMINAYNPASGPGAFDGVADILDPVCTGVFGP